MLEDIKEQFEFIFNKVIIKSKKGGILTFELTHDLSHSEWIETDGVKRITVHDNNNYRVEVYNYTFALLIKEQDCMYKECCLYLSREKYEEGIINVKEHYKYF